MLHLVIIYVISVGVDIYYGPRNNYTLRSNWKTLILSCDEIIIKGIIE